MVEVNVAIYKAPSLVDLAHWAIEVKKEEISLIYQVLGYATAFHFDCSQKKAQNSTQFYRYVAIAKDLNSLESLHDIICDTPVNNDDEDFNCQSWVVEVVRNIHQAGLIPKHEYLQAAANLQEIFGVDGIPLPFNTNPFR